ncbi:MAG: hypothetical protein ACRDGR_06475 [bacterium]
MKRLFLAATIAVSLAAPTARAGADNRYGWTISNSSTNPLANTGTATSSVTSLYLWFYCSGSEGMAAAEFDIEASGISHLATTTMNGFLNAGGTSNLLLAVGGCPEGPVLAANLLVLDAPGTLCLVPSAANGVRGTVDCDELRPSLWNVDWIGYSSRGDACRVGVLCDSPLESQAWSQVKSRYR